MNSKTFSNSFLRDYRAKSKTSWRHNHVYILSYKHSSRPIRARVLSYLFYKFIRRSHRSMLVAMVRINFIWFYWNGWMKIDCSFWYTNHVQWHTNHVKEKVKSTISLPLVIVDTTSASLCILSVNSISIIRCVAVWNIPIHNEDFQTYSIQ